MPSKSFPRRQDRQQLLDELYRTLGKDVELPELFKTFVDAIKKVDDRLNQLSELDERTQLAPTVDSRTQVELMNLYAEAGKAGETFLGTIDEKKLPKGAASQLVTRVQGLLARDYNALQSYKPEEPKTMPELLEQSRTRTIDLRGRHIKAYGNMQNSRIPMTLKNAEGERRSGVFTKANKVEIEARFHEILDSAKQACNEEGKAQLDKLLPGIRQYLITTGTGTADSRKVTEKTPNTVVLGMLSAALTPEILGYDKLSTSIVRDFMGKNGVELSSVSSEGMKRLTKGLQGMVDSIDIRINGHSLQLQEGARLDTRNAAMSAMAGMLGVPNLVARAEPMKFIDDSGQVVEGTFMEYAKGLDLHRNMKLTKHLQVYQTGDPQAQNSLVKSLADLQVVDYLCLNVDRHVGNMSYIVNEQGYVTGVQAFDNDSSFGDRVPLKSDLDKISVMSKSMCNRVRSLTPEMLRFGLRGHGLSNGELYAASARLVRLQERIRKNEINVVPDDKLGQLTTSQLTAKSPNNIVRDGLRFINQEATTYAEEHRYTFEPYQEKGPNLSEVGTTDRRFTMGGVMDAGDMVGRLIHDKDNNFKVGDLTNIRGSSKEFREMVQAAKDLVNLQNQLRGDKAVDEQQLVEDNSTQNTMQQLGERYTALEEKINSYFTRKLGQIHAADVDHLQGRNPYEDRRIQYAKKLMTAVNDFKNIQAGKPANVTDEEKQALISQRQQRQLRQQQQVRQNSGAVAAS